MHYQVSALLAATSAATHMGQSKDQQETEKPMTVDALVEQFAADLNELIEDNYTLRDPTEMYGPYLLSDWLKWEDEIGLFCSYTVEYF